MVTGRTKGLTLRGKGNVVLVAAQLDDADGNPTEEYVLLRADEFGRLRTVGGGAAVSTFLALTDTPASYVGQGLLNVRVNVGEDALEFAAITSHAAMMPQIDDLGLTTWGIPGWAIPAGMTGATLTVDNRFYCPIYVERSRTFTQIGIHVSTLAALAVVRLGIYAGTFVDGDLTPGDLILDAGTVSVATTGQKSIVIAQPLAEGFHFLVASSDGAPILIIPNEAGAVSVPVTGRRNIINAAQRITSRVVVADGAAALPDPATAPTTGLPLSGAMVFIGE